MTPNPRERHEPHLFLVICPGWDPPSTLCPGAGTGGNGHEGSCARPAGFWRPQNPRSAHIHPPSAPPPPGRSMGLLPKRGDLVPPQDALPAPKLTSEPGITTGDQWDLRGIPLPSLPPAWLCHPFPTPHPCSRAAFTTNHRKTLKGAQQPPPGTPAELFSSPKTHWGASQCQQKAAALARAAGKGGQQLPGSASNDIYGGGRWGQLAAAAAADDYIFF